MAKFTIEVELDWMYEGENIDEEIYKQVINGIQDRLTKNLEAEMKDKLTEMIDENVSRITDKFLKEIVTDKIEKINIPTKEDSWSSKVEMVPISEYIGKRFERMATEKNLNERGGEYRRYDNDRGPYSLIEYLTNNYIAKELNDKVVEMIKQAKTRAEQTLIESLEENLQSQLNRDMVERLNVPELLKKLEDTVMIEEEN